MRKDDELKAKANELAQALAMAQDYHKKHTHLESQFKSKDMSEEGLKAVIKA